VIDLAGYYLAKAKQELENLIEQLCNQFKIERLDAIKQLQNALDEVEQAEVLKPNEEG
jgi:alpha-N-acetylglucosamine transferase